MQLDLLAIIAPVICVAGIGWLWVRLGRTYDRTLITRLITDIGAPCLVFSSLVELGVTPERLLQMSAAAALGVLCCAAVGLVVLRASRLPAHTFLAPLTFGNAGNLGLPLCMFAFGEEGLALAACYFGTVSLVHYTAGVWVWSGQLSPRLLLRTPLAWAALLAVLALATGFRLPRWLANTTDLLGRLTIPLMLLTLGAALYQLELRGLGRTLALSALRLGLGFAVGVGVASALGLEGVARGVVIIQGAMPVAVFNYLFAERYERSPEAVASLVVASTLIAFVLLPGLLAFALSP